MARNLLQPLLRAISTELMEKWRKIIWYHYPCRVLRRLCVLDGKLFVSPQKLTFQFRSCIRTTIGMIRNRLSLPHSRSLISCASQSHGKAYAIWMWSDFLCSLHSIAYTIYLYQQHSISNGGFYWIYHRTNYILIISAY